MNNSSVKTVCLLYSDKVSVTVSDEAIKAAVQRINKQHDKIINVITLCADSLSDNEDFSSSSDRIDLLINTLGPYYPEEGLGKILNYYQKGGAILNVGIKPFSTPYSVRDNRVHYCQENNEAIREFRILDEYMSTGAKGNGHKIDVINPKYGFISELNNNGEFPEMIETYAANYHFGSSVEKDVEWPDMVGRIEANLDTVCGWRDKDDRLLTVPITRVEHHDGQTFILMNFSPKAPDYYNTESGIKFLSGMIMNELMGNVRLSLKSEYARYMENEIPCIIINIDLEGSKKDYAGCNSLTCRVIHMDRSDYSSEYYYNDIDLSRNTFKQTLYFQNLEEGFYKVEAGFSLEGTCVAECSTGFYKLSNASIRKTLDKFKPLTIDTTISTDFCLQEGKVYPIHGTTYFTTDVYRNCFIDLNVYRCDQEMQEIRKVGFNLLRTGNWQRYHEFYKESGEINEVSLRALDAFFLSAARNGLPVQFVLGAYIFNHWNRKQCPIHHPEARKKSIAAFISFAKRYGDWPNVSVDAINEPSYSIAGKWTPARPSGDPYEKLHWTRWLKAKYENDITLLREVWGVTSVKIPDFDDIDLPSMEQFQRDYDRKDNYRNYAVMADFYAFAQESYSEWVSDIRHAVKGSNPNMLFMMGRDESLRIPCQQYEAYKGHFDMVNWHQWHQDSAIFSEYFLNRVRGIPCCAQELGVYHYDDLRGNMRMTEQDYAKVLERKLLYSFGNWVQWQLDSDPNMLDNCEIALGLKRADKSETPHMNITRHLLFIEEKMAHYMAGKQEEKVEILTVHPSSMYYSADSSMAKRGAANSLISLHYHLKMQSDMVLEHCFRVDNQSQIGKPKLIILPAAQMISQKTWDLLVTYMKAGTTVLISGSAELDEYGRHWKRLEELGADTAMNNIYSTEKIKIGDTEYHTSYRECVGSMNPSKVLNKTIYKNSTENVVQILTVGKGKLIHCPLPLEIGDTLEPITSLYKLAMQEAGVENRICNVLEIEVSPHILLYPISYQDCTLYTIVNEGEDSSVSFKDLESGSNVTVFVKGQRGAKLWLDKKGMLIGAYINDRLSVNGEIIIPKGDTSFCHEDGQWIYFTGDKTITEAPDQGGL